MAVRHPKFPDEMSYDHDSLVYAGGPPRGPRLFGVGVNIDASWLIFAVFIASQFWGEFKSLGAAAAIPAIAMIVIGLSLSIFLHEMSHTLTGRALGMQIDRITLYMFGGVAELQDEPRNPYAEFLMAIAGPAFSVLLWWVLGIAAQVSGQAHAPASLQVALGVLSDLNLALAIFNMIPAFPMDGGRVLRSIIWMVSGKVGLATRIAAFLGQGFGVVLMIWGAYVAIFGGGIFAGLWRIVLGVMLMGMAKAGRRAAPQD